MSSKNSRTTFVKNILSLASASVLAQIINFGFNIFLARVYLPEHFGNLAFFLSITSFVIVLSAGKFDVALVASDNDEDAKKLLSLSFVVLFFVSLAILIVTLIIKIFNLYTDPVISDWLFYLVPSVIFLTGFHSLWMWNVRFKNFKKISYVRVMEPIVNGGLSLVFASLFSYGLLIGTLLGQLVSFVLLILIVLKNESFQSFLFSRAELFAIFKKYIIYPKINIFQSFLDTFQVSSFILLLDYFFNASVVGFYALGMRVLQVPVRLLVLPVAHVFFAEVSELYRNGQSIKPLVTKTIYRIALIALPIPVFLFFFGEDLFVLVFGENWRIAGEYAKILAFWTFFDLVKAPIMQIASILNKQKEVLYFSIFSSAIFLVVFLFGGMYFKDEKVTLIMITISQSILSLVLLKKLVNYTS
jgi:O-antigen/teichoic acid export membrane protein